jgi:hypothetical protein
MSRTLIQEIASCVDARLTCIKRGNTEWESNHTLTLKTIEKDLLSSGSGIDCGTRIDLDRSTGNKVVLILSFHHMDDNGMYCGWTEHTLTVKPHLIHDIDLTISGRNRNDIKDYLHETYRYNLTRPCRWNQEKKRHVLDYSS